MEIDLDDIVVLVGPNNAGKSTILRAYEVVMSHGSTEGKLKIEDYPREKCEPDCVPEIELQTYVFDNLPAKQWLHTETTRPSSESNGLKQEPLPERRCFAPIGSP